MDVKREICEFVEINESGGALLFTGQWGCGKTHLIREIASELNSGDNYAVIIISLFGIDSVDQLHKKVKESIFYAQILHKKANGLSPIINPIKERISAVAEVLSEHSKIAKGINTALSINLFDFIVPTPEISCYYDKDIKKKRLVLIFDDFERCKIDNVELLGAINDYSENVGIKTIIIAEEKYISDESYGDFKEKVISRTVRLVSDYNRIISTIVDNYKETTQGYKFFLQKNKDLLLQVFNESKQENIRTFKTYIIAFERIYQVWTNSAVPADKMPQILYAFGVIHFEAKANNYQKHEKYGYLFAESQLKDKYSKLTISYQLEPLQKWIVEGIWDEKEFIDVLQIHFAPKTISFYEIFLNWDFWNLDDEIISRGMPDALALAYDGRLCCHDLISLLGRVQILNKHNIPLPCDIDYSKLYTGFKTRENAIKAGSIEEPRNPTFLSPDQVMELCEEAKILYKEIEMMQDRKAAWEYRRVLINYLKAPDSTDNSKLRRQCIVSFDNELLELFVSAYKTASNSQKRELYQTLNGITFDYHYVSRSQDILETVNNLRGFVAALSEMLTTEKDSFAKYIINETIVHVNEMANRIAEGSEIAT